MVSEEITVTVAGALTICCSTFEARHDHGLGIDGGWFLFGGRLRGLRGWCGLLIGGGRLSGGGLLRVTTAVGTSQHRPQSEETITRTARRAFIGPPVGLGAFDGEVPERQRIVMPELAAIRPR